MRAGADDMANFKVFALVLLEPNADIVRRAEETYPDTFQFTDTFFLLKVPATELSNAVAERVGLKGDHQIEGASGFVIQQRRAYSGYTRKDLWEWLTSNAADLETEG